MSLSGITQEGGSGASGNDVTGVEDPKVNGEERRIIPLAMEGVGGVGSISGIWSSAMLNYDSRRLTSVETTTTACRHPQILALSSACFFFMRSSRLSS